MTQIVLDRILESYGLQMEESEDIEQETPLDLSGQNLRNLNLDGAILYRVNFEKADLRGSSMRRTLSRRANFKDAQVDDTDFSYSDLRESNILSVNSNNKTLLKAAL